MNAASFFWKSSGNGSSQFLERVPLFELRLSSRSSFGNLERAAELQDAAELVMPGHVRARILHIHVADAEMHVDRLRMEQPHEVQEVAVAPVRKYQRK